MPKQKKLSRKELLGYLTKYAVGTKCACSACRTLREYRTQNLEEEIKTLKEQLNLIKKAGGKT